MNRLIFIAFIFFWGFGFSQEKPVEDLKVGLVLSGGGAKGMAHIGALKIIEEAGIRIDYIGGTSMGAIVGGLYASGYSANQLDSIFKSIDFNRLIQDEIPRRAKTFYEREESEKYAITFPVNKFKVSLPKGISKGQNFYNMLSKLTSHVNDVEDFSKLPIPFLCVATNLESGKETVLKSGYLPRAIRASGTLPTLFSPVKINDSLYIDGGVKNNYPVDEVRAMGADIIIGIDVQDTLKTRKELKSVLNIMTQINNYRTIENMEIKSKKTDIYIHPNIKNYNVVSFAEGNEIIDAGTQEARLYFEELKTIAKRQKATSKKDIEFPDNDMLYITRVEIEGNEKYSRAYVLGKLKLKTPANTSYQNFSDGINNLSATGNFQEINYRFQQDKDGGIVVKFNLIESETNTLLRLGVHYDNLYKTGLLANITQKRLITNNDITSFDFIFGDKVRYNFDYYIDKGFYWSIGVKSNYNNFDENVSLDFVFPDLLQINSEINEINFDYGQLTNQIYVETLFKRIFLIGAGGEHKWIEYVSNTIGVDEDDNPRTVFDNTSYFSTYGYLIFDTLDNKHYPTEGLYFHGDIHLYLYADGFNKDFNEFSIGTAKISYAQTIFRNFAAVLHAEGGVKFGGDLTKSFDFFVGGYGFKETNNLVALYGYENLNLRGNTFLKATIDLDYIIFQKSHIIASANIANVGDDLFDTKQWIDGIDHTGYALGIGWDSILGPIEAKYSYSPEREDGVWYVSVGYRF